MYTDGTIVLSTISDCKEYCQKYHCQNVSELEELLWNNYGISLQVDQVLRTFFSSNRNFL